VDHRELEWQLSAPDLPAVRRWLTEHPTLDEFQIEPRGPVELHDTYLDTDDWRFHRAGFALRARASSDGAEATLKSLTSARSDAADRREMSEALSDTKLESLTATSGDVGKRVRAVTGDRPLRPLFEVRTARERFAIRRHGTEIGEVALDDTLIGRAGGEPQARVLRVEVEALTPSGDSLQNFVEALRGGCGLQPATESKFRLGLEATGLSPPAHTDGEAPATDPSMRIAELARVELRRRLDQWFTHEPGARLGDDPEHLHDLRIAGRRIDAALGLFDGHLPRGLRRIRPSIKRLVRLLGVARDLDVQLAELESIRIDLPETEGAKLEPVRARLIAQRERARARMLAALDAPETQSRLHALWTAAHGAPTGDARGNRPAAMLIAPQLIRRRFKKLRRVADQLTGDSSMEDYHEARRQTKRLRYAVECVVGLYGEDADEFLSVVRRLQNRLGEQQDAHVSSTRLADLVKPRTPRIPPATVFLMGQLAERQHTRALEARKRFPKAYRKVRGRRWKELRRAMRDVEKSTTTPSEQ
jgi:triphosphatase